MRTIQSTITSKGQSTIPAEIRKRLGIAQRGRFLWVIDDETISVKPAEYTLESAFGSLPRSIKTEEIDEVITQAKQERANRAVAKLQRP